MIALAFPAALGIAMMVIGIPALGIGALIEKIRERRRKRHLEAPWENAYEFAEEQQEIKEPLISGAEQFIVHSLDAGVQTRAQLNSKGKALGHSEAAIGKGLNNLMEVGSIKRIARGVYSKPPPPVQTEDERTKQSNTLGIWSLATGIVGIFLWPSAIAAIVLGALQFRRHVSKCSIAGFVLGIVGIVSLFAWPAFV